MEFLKNVIQVQDEKFDPFSPALVSTDTIKRDYVAYTPDSGTDTFTAIRNPGYKLTTKDLDAIQDMSQAYLEIVVNTKLRTDALAAVDGVATEAAVTGNSFLPAVAAQTSDKTIAELNALLATRVENDGTVTDAIGIVNAYNLFKNARLRINGSEIENYADPGKIVDVKFHSESSPHNARALENHARLYAPSRLNPTNMQAAEAGACHIALPLALLFDSLAENYRYTRGMKYEFDFQPETSMAAVMQSVHSKGAGLVVNAGELYISRLRLMVPTVYPSMDAIKRYESALLKSQGSLRIFQGARYHKSAASTAATQNILVTTESKAVDKVYVWVALAAPETTYNDDNWKKGISTLTSISLRFNSDVIPQNPYDMDLSTKDAMRPYVEYLAANGKGVFDSLENEPLLTFKEWVEDQNVYCFSVPQKYTTYPNKMADIHVKATFSSSPASYYIHTVVVTNDELRINSVGDQLVIAPNN